MSDIQKGDVVYIIRRARQSEVIQQKTVDKVRTDYGYFPEGKAIVCDGTAYRPENVFTHINDAKRELVSELEARIARIKSL
jgi:bifunctional DNA-binding transcriptional regulator/antitoxin component of YhaV-PrlF toxin-antitoxin module